MTHLKPKLLVVLLAVASLCTTALIVLTTLNRRQHRQETAIPILGAQVAGKPLFEKGLALPHFALTERSGRTMNTDQLKDKVWIANFIFTRCAGTCPLLTRQMANLQKDLESHPRWRDMQLVTISVDPDYDTPLRLQQYAESYGADPEHWLFLTGTRHAIRNLCREGFKQTVEDIPDNPAMPILHTQNLVLVDRNNHIRGYYDGLDVADRARLRHDLERLVDN